MDPLPVTLIVKAPNQQFEDQTIKCEPTWSIRRLKGYLSEVYPCNPTLDEQKLIYSGQLLNDAHILKDVLRQYEGQETHTVHLVYTPKNRHMASTTSFKSSQSTTRNDATDSSQSARQQTSTQSQQSQQSAASFAADGLRYRNGNAGPNSAASFAADGLRYRNGSAGSNANTNQAPPPFMTGYLNMPQPFMPEMSFAQPNANQPQPQYTPEQYTLAQQMAMQNMMHQMYLQYMNQYATAIQQQQQSGATSNVPFIPSNYFPQPNFGMPQQFSAATAGGSTSGGGEQQQAQAQQDAPPVVPAPRFQPVAAVADDEAENRDWLEILYTLSRLLVLLSLVYFYSSPGRCSIVIIVIVLYYFYQNHQRNLRERQQLERLQEAANEADVIDAPADNNEQQNANDDENNQRNEAESTPLINQETDSSTATPSSPSAEQDESNRLPTLTLVRTFILSFFSSLIPETPAV